jgi:hypothetical protein
MTGLHDVLHSYVAAGTVPGAVGLVARGDITPSTGTIAILLTQVAADDPVAPGLMRDFWRHAAGA